MVKELRQGNVVAVCKSPEHGYPTYPQSLVVIGMPGIEGDAHSGALRESFTKPGTMKPNDRPISIVADEVRREMNARFGLHIKPGGFNEQILVRDLGDLSYVEIGDQVVFDSGVELEITDVAYPCTKLSTYHGEPGLIEALLIPEQHKKPKSKRGILARVVTPGELHEGVGVALLRNES